MTCLHLLLRLLSMTCSENATPAGDDAGTPRRPERWLSDWLWPDCMSWLTLRTSRAPGTRIAAAAWRRKRLGSLAKADADREKYEELMAETRR
jgi:hypothetical protein